MFYAGSGRAADRFASGPNDSGRKSKSWRRRPTKGDFRTLSVHYEEYIKAVDLIAVLQFRARAAIAKRSTT